MLARSVISMDLIDCTGIPLSQVAIGEYREILRYVQLFEKNERTKNQIPVFQSPMLAELAMYWPVFESYLRPTRTRFAVRVIHKLSAIASSHSFDRHSACWTASVVVGLKIMYIRHV